MAKMKQEKVKRQYYNIFADELESILQAHGASLSLLNDRTNINPAKVVRLQRSLYLPPEDPSRKNPPKDERPHCHVLRLDELKTIRKAFGLKRSEAIRLSAAIIATLIERALMSQMDPELAFRAANQMLPNLQIILQTQKGEDEPDVQEKGIGMFVDIEAILEIIDQANSALYLGQTARSPEDRLNYGRSAKTVFELAQGLLDQIPEGQQNADWQAGSEDVQYGLEQIRQWKIS